MSNTLQDVSKEHADALTILSKTALDQEIARSEAAATQNAAIGTLLKSQPASACGCLPKVQACGYFCINASPCACGPGNIVVTAGPFGIGGRNVTFTGTGANFQPDAINLSSVYFSGQLPPAESLVGVQVRLHIEITPYSGTIYVYENFTPVGTLIALTQTARWQQGARNFSGDVYGYFYLS
ncbi:hypothetical protein [Methylosinus sp. Sm6]|uniref:hypothetical protein n=1 Tax=Methylosinus sp. Sm6 TaxID=2866948 RepID=UPI001C9921CC|nr:hypothetical protein [Methylosinus sp. Sm6]MBY6241578.1 hypothetical protein [Methylosinus sp. Sm6]